MKTPQITLGKEELLDLAIKIIGLVWFVRSSIALLTVLLQGGSFWLIGGCEKQIASRIGASIVVLVFSVILMMQSSFFVSLLYGRRPNGASGERDGKGNDGERDGKDG